MITNSSAHNTHPYWLIDILDYFIRRTIFRRPIPLIASVKLTYRCNLRCRGCPFHQLSSEENCHMSRETAITALEGLKRLGTKIVIFEGGEPFLWSDGAYGFSDIVSYARKLFFRVGVTTNGTFPLDAPVDTLWISVDGLSETHNYLRDNSFQRVLRNVAASPRNDILFHFTINSKNMHEISDVATLIGHLPAVKGMTLQFFYPYDRGEDTLSLSPSQRREAIESAISLKKSGLPILNSTGRLRAMIDNNWRCHENILANVEPDGTIMIGCYVKNRGKIRCTHCGFTPVAEASGAVDFLPGSMLTGWKIFIAR